MGERHDLGCQKMMTTLSIKLREPRFDPRHGLGTISYIIIGIPWMLKRYLYYIPRLAISIHVISENEHILVFPQPMSAYHVCL